MAYRGQVERLLVHFEHLTVFVDKQVGSRDRQVETENLEDKVFHAQNLEMAKIMDDF